MSTNSDPPSENIYDVAVIGGGPGGAALATFLARNGRRCLVVEQAEFPRYHIG
jgi:flavin-dependent dehydrogenase